MSYAQFCFFFFVISSNLVLLVYINVIASLLIDAASFGSDARVELAQDGVSRRDLGHNSAQKWESKFNEKKKSYKLYFDFLLM